MPRDTAQELVRHKAHEDRLARRDRARDRTGWIGGLAWRETLAQMTGHRLLGGIGGRDLAARDEARLDEVDDDPVGERRDRDPRRAIEILVELEGRRQRLAGSGEQLELVL